MALSRAATRPIASLLNPAIGRRRYSSSRASGAPGGRPSHQVACFDPSRLPCGGGGLLSSRWYSGGASPADNMSLIKQLRERTCAPIKDVKSALISCDWDHDAAQKELRKRGVVLASKKSARTAAEGLLALAQSESKVAVIELNCETDFVARNDICQYLALSLARTALSVEGQHGDIGFAFGPEHLEEVKIRFDHPKLTGETTGQSAITEVAAMVGENVKLRRGFTMSKSSHGVVSSYLHTCPQPVLGRIVGVLTLESDDENVSLDALQKVGSSLAMHIVAAKPLFLSNELVSSEAIANEREILKTQVVLYLSFWVEDLVAALVLFTESTGKSQMAVEKMVEGRLRKYFEDVVLLEQKFVMNDATNVKSILKDLSEEVGSSVRIGKFYRMEVGERISKAEVEAVAQAA